MKKNVLLLSALFASIFAYAAPEEHVIEQKLKNYNIKAESIKPSPIAGVNSVITSTGVIYITDDGKYLIEGTIYDLSGKVPTNIINKQLLAKVEALKDEMIIFKSPKEKHVITVFTDITCGYCQKLHSSVKEMNEKGITVRYLAFPRHGLNHPSYKQMSSIWCNALPQKALTEAFKGEEVALIEDCKIDLSRHMQIGRQFGITGTPAILLDNGQLISGYLPVDRLIEALDHK